MKKVTEQNAGLPKVAIVGRPNVGKSSIFNRITGARQAIVHRELGTTRDRISQRAEFKGRKFILTDTGGFILGDKTRILKMVKEQIKKAIDESDILLFVCDAQAGLLPEDFELALTLRKSNKKIFLIVNKVDNQKIEDTALDFYQLGLDKPYSVSAAHDIGMDELLDSVIRQFSSAAPREEIEEKETEPIKVAIVGRPNVGKSSFLNYLLKEDRVIVDEMPGTTRDTIDTYLKEEGAEYILIDTAGLRHKRKIKEAVDVYSVMRTKEAIKRSQVTLVLIDGHDGLVVDDLKILDMVLKEGKSCILCINKWDLTKGLPQADYTKTIYERAQFLTKYPIVFTSAKTGYNVYNTLRHIKEVADNANLKVSTHRLNKLLNSIKSNGPFSPRRNKLRPSYITQTKTNPPTFLIFVNESRFVTEEHRNFMENLLRRNFGFFGAPIQFYFREAKGGKI